MKKARAKNTTSHNSLNFLILKFLNKRGRLVALLIRPLLMTEVPNHLVLFLQFSDLSDLMVLM